MTTTTPGGVVSFRTSLTFIGASALTINDPVMIVGDYEVDKADGTKPTVGSVEVPNVKRQGGVFPVANPGGDVTVGVRGYGVKTVAAGGAIEAGGRVKAGPGGTYIAAAVGDEGQVGIALTGTAALGDNFDLLYN